MLQFSSDIESTKKTESKSTDFYIHKESQPKRRGSPNFGSVPFGTYDIIFVHCLEIK